MTRSPGRCGSSLVLLAVIVAASSGARAQEPPSAGQKLALYTKPSVVRVIGAWRGEFRFANRSFTVYTGGTGSGFFINGDGYIATNAHVVQVIHDGEDKAKEALGKEFIRQVLGAMNIERPTPEIIRKIFSETVLADKRALAIVVLPNGERASYDIKAYGAPIGEGKDCAIIKIPTRNAPTLPIGDSTKVQIQDRIYVIGYPGVADIEGLLDEKSQLESSITDGAVSAIKATAAGDQVIQVSTPITHGNSGGPAINQDGDVVGIATFGNAKEVQGFNFLVSASTLNEFVRQAGASNAPTETNASWHAALDLFWDRRYSAAIEELQEVESLFPAHMEAHKLQVSARELKRAGKERRPTILFVGGGALFAALGLAGTSIILKRRRRPQGAPDSMSSMSSGRAVVSGPVPAVASARSSPSAAPAPATGAGSGPSAPVAPTVFAAGRVGTLTCTRGSLSGQRFTLTPSGLLIGRQPGVAHIVISDGRASGKHCWVRWEDGQLLAIDQGTTNGTFLNDPRSRITRARLNDGDTLIIADPDCCSLSVKLS